MEKLGKKLEEKKIAGAERSKNKEENKRIKRELKAKEKKKMMMEKFQYYDSEKLERGVPNR